jgi:hypothetical protein
MAFIDLVIQDFNEGDYDLLETAFNGDVNAFFNYANKKGKIEEIIADDYNHNDYENDYSLWVSNNKPEIFRKIIEDKLSDVTYIDGKWYFITSDRGDLSKLYCDDRDIGRNTIESILSGEYDSYNYWDSGIDVYDNVIDDLNDQNKQTLIERLLEELKDEEILPSTDLLKEIASSQGHDEYVSLDTETLSRIINDKESIKEILPDDLESELVSLYWSAYNVAYEDELYESIWSELDTIFEGNGEWTQTPSPYDKNKFTQKFQIPFIDLESIVKDYLEDNLRYKDRTLEYWGNIINIIDDTHECLRVRVPEYAGWTETKQNINSLYNDYIS